MITGIEERHPEVTSGFIYFLSFGDTTHLVGDYLILEEDAATSDTITQIHEIFSYFSLSFLKENKTINGMFYILRTDILKKYSAFENIKYWLCDDLNAEKSTDLHDRQVDRSFRIPKRAVRQYLSTGLGD